MAAQDYRALFAGVDSTESDAAALRLQTMVEGVLAYLKALSGAK